MEEKVTLAELKSLTNETSHARITYMVELIPAHQKELSNMKTETDNGTVETAYGQDIPKDKQDYSYDFKVFENSQEASDAGHSLVKLANAAERNAAKAAAYQKVINPYKPDPNSPAELLKSFIATAVKMGVPKDLATQQAEAMLAAVKK